MPDFTLFQLDVDCLSEAYPLVRSASRLSHECWEAYARDLLRQGGGVVAVRAEDAQVHGVAAFREVGSPGRCRSLLVELVATFEMSRAAWARKALLAGIEQMARSRGCRNLVFTLPAPPAAKPAMAGLPPAGQAELPTDSLPSSRT